jgi:hypothetical protein
VNLRHLVCVTLTGLPLAMCTASIDNGATPGKPGASVPIWQQKPTPYNGTGGGGSGGEGGGGSM